jgi:hypothetical protein
MSSSSNSISRNASRTKTTAAPDITGIGSTILTKEQLNLIKNQDAFVSAMGAEVQLGKAMLQQYQVAINNLKTSVQEVMDYEKNRKAAIKTQITPYLDTNLTMFSKIHR